MWWLAHSRKYGGVLAGTRASGAGRIGTSATATASSHCAAGRGARRVARLMTIATITATANQVKSVKRPGRTCLSSGSFPNGSHGSGTCSGFLADVQPRPERENEEQRPGDARDADPQVVPLANGHDDEQDEQRQAEVRPSPRDRGR